MSDIVSLQGIAALGHLGSIRARGDEAAAFLQSQLTNDMSGLGMSEARLAGYCSYKGRLQASFVACKLGADEFLLVCSADLLTATLKRLSMFVLRARCRLSNASAEFRLSGLAGAAAERWLGDAAPRAPWSVAAHGEARVLRLPDAAATARFLLVAPAASDAPPLEPLAIDAWRWLEVQSGVPRIEAVNVEQFVPQMVNLDLVGGVNFQKGCYPGQEVVARSQYRGTIKRRMALFDLDAPVQAGDEVFHDADPAQPAGRVVNAAPHPARAAASSALVEVKLAALEGGSLHLGAVAGARLEPRPLPYSLAASVA